MIGIIYMAENIVNGKRYIGQSTLSLANRKKGHLSESKRGSKGILHKAIRKYGKDNFRWTIIMGGIDKQEILDRLEATSIEKYSTMVPDGYNLREGGYGGKLSEQGKEKLKAAFKKRSLNPVWIKGIIERNKNPSDEMKSKMAVSAKARAGTKEYREIAKKRFHTLWITDREKMMEAIRKRESKRIRKPITVKVPKYKPVKCIETGNIYMRASDARNELGIDNSQIGKACKIAGKTAGGYHWEYVSDYGEAKSA
jgi:group I intron endonuclease